MRILGRSVHSLPNWGHLLLLRRLIAVSLQHTQDRLHLGVGQSLVRVHARGARGCEQRPEVRLGHLDSMLQLPRAFREAARAPLRLHAHLSVLATFFPGRLQLRTELGNLLAQLHQPIHGGPAQVRVRQAATTSGACFLGPLAGASASALDRLPFALGDGGRIQQTI